MHFKRLHYDTQVSFSLQIPHFKCFTLLSDIGMLTSNLILHMDISACSGTQKRSDIRSCSCVSTQSCCLFWNKAAQQTKLLNYNAHTLVCLSSLSEISWNAAGVSVSIQRKLNIEISIFDISIFILCLRPNRLCCCMHVPAYSHDLLHLTACMNAGGRYVY